MGHGHKRHPYPRKKRQNNAKFDPMTSCISPLPSSLAFLKGSSSFHALRTLLHQLHSSALFVRPTPRPSLHHPLAPTTPLLRWSIPRRLLPPISCGIVPLIFSRTSHSQHQHWQEGRAPVILTHSLLYPLLTSSSVRKFHGGNVKFPVHQSTNPRLANPDLCYIHLKLRHHTIVRVRKPCSTAISSADSSAGHTNTAINPPSPEASAASSVQSTR